MILYTENQVSSVKRIPAFSLLEIAIVLLIVGIIMATVVPILERFHRCLNTKVQIQMALKSLGAYVAMHEVLPVPDLIQQSSGNILSGYLPYQRLGLVKNGPTICYAVDKNLTLTTTAYNFCSNYPNQFGQPLDKDLVAFELSIGQKKIQIRRNNFYAQYCGGVCHPQKVKSAQVLD